MGEKRRAQEKKAEEERLKHMSEENRKEALRRQQQEKMRAEEDKNWLLSWPALPDEPAPLGGFLLPASLHPSKVSALAKDVFPLPGNLKEDEDVFFCGSLKTLEDGSKLMFGTPGKAVAGASGGQLSARFNGVKLLIALDLEEVSREPPSLPKGYQAGDIVYYAGAKRGFDNGNFLKFGLSGEVVGPSTPPDDRRIEIWFEGNPQPMDYVLAQIMKEEPVIPGGYKVGDLLYYSGEMQIYDDGDRLTFGLMGEVVSRSTAGNSSDDRRLKVLFNGNNMPISVFLTQVSRDEPQLPGGYMFGDRVLYLAAKKQKFPNGDQLFKGMFGEISGKSTMGDGSDERRIKVKFDGNKGPVNVFIQEIEETPESRAAKEARKKAKKKDEEDARKNAEAQAKQKRVEEEQEAKRKKEAAKAQAALEEAARK